MRYAALCSYLLWPYATGGERTILEILGGLQRAGNDVVIRYAIPPGLPDQGFEEFMRVIRGSGLDMVSSSRDRVEYRAEGVSVQTVRVEGSPRLWFNAWVEELEPDMLLLQAKDVLLLPVAAAFWHAQSLVFLQEIEALSFLQKVLTPEARRRITRSGAAMVTCSNYLQCEALGAGFESTVLYPTLRLLPRGSSVSPTGPVTTFATSSDKGIEVIHALALRMPDLRFRIVGDWAGRNMLPTGTNVERAPFELDPWCYYDPASLVLLPSRCHEGFGRIAFEAMAVGRVPVVSDRGALPEVVGPQGVVVPYPESDEELDHWGSALRAALRPDALQVMATRGRRRAEELTAKGRQQFASLFGTTYPA